MFPHDNQPLPDGCTRCRRLQQQTQSAFLVLHPESTSKNSDATHVKNRQSGNALYQVSETCKYYRAGHPGDPHLRTQQAPSPKYRGVYQVKQTLRRSTQTEL
ncbi:unnamed protein product [Kuraishia capsulata CBS 1993]|uniref:Uncharacterized protein n=1 Tax=Kuraishia capsulata CBS 1993 TaxID=1382522 RepID=W6MJN7_9ASCO|nr:uncharacterized protein KUCA_T00002169001 [Kuraishia capsulata CBS 1993]CDK26198.1 unnamed protein product [Kuraishia capsulata CBS 1993]